MVLLVVTAGYRCKCQLKHLLSIKRVLLYFNPRFPRGKRLLSMPPFCKNSIELQPDEVVLPLSRITTLSNLKLHFHASVLCKCIRLHRAARLLAVYHYSKIWHKSLSIMKRSSFSIVSWQGPSIRMKLRFSSLAFS